MNFITYSEFDVQKGTELDLRDWLAQNEEKIAAETPDGLEYLGTFTTIFGPEASVNTFRTVWAMDNYAAIDTFTKAVKAGGTFADLMDVLGSYQLDRQDGGIQMNVLTRRVTDAAIWGVDQP